MFVGHYAVSLALKSQEKRASLGMLFLAVQAVDIVFFPLVLLGIERLQVIENYTESTHFMLEFMPYTHSLLAAFIWAGLTYFVFARFVVKIRPVAWVLSLAVFSHWVLDLVVHTPDLPLWSDTSLKLGFGLWENAAATYTLEAFLLLGALYLYMKSTNASSSIGKFGMAVFCVLLLTVNAGNIFGPLASDSTIALALPTMVMYVGFAGVAFWLDRKRQ